MTDSLELKITEQEKKDYNKILTSIHLQLKKLGFHIKKEWYPSGYLIENDHKMWHLELKECPDWKFGVWLDSEKEYYRLYVFAQHKNYINKFKPTDCKVVEKYQVWKEDLASSEEISEWDLKEWTEIFRYVKEQPYLAWYRNETYTDYNTKYVSPAEAKKKFLKSEKECRKYQKAQSEIDKAELAWMKKYLDSLGYKYKITTDDYAIPRHDVVIEKPAIETKGWYSLMDDEDWAEFSSIHRRIKEKNKLKYGVYSTFNNVAWFVKELK